MHLGKEIGLHKKNNVSPHLLTGAVRLLFGDGGGAALTGGCSGCWGHGDSGTKTGAWIS